MAVTGQLWYSTEGIDEDAFVAYVNSDSNSSTVVVDNNPTIDLQSGFANHVVIDSAAGLYFVLVGGNDGVESKLLVGRIGSPAAPTLAFNFDPTPSGNPANPNNITLSLEIDPINERLYVGFAEFNPNFANTTQGIRQFSYDPATGGVSGGALVATQATANIQPSALGATGLFGPRDFDIDASRNVLYATQFTLGDGFETNALVRLNLADLDGSSAVSLVNPTLFPLDGNSSDFSTMNGIIQDVEVDKDSNRVYFVTHAEDVEESTGEDAIWLVENASTATNATPVKLTLSSGSFAASFVTSNFYPGDMVIDEVNNILYVDSENSNLVGGGITDVILKFQLATNGLSATLIDVINPGFDQTANVEGLFFNQLARIAPLTANAALATEQVTALDLLTAAPVISDFDGDHLNNATVSLGNSFVGSGDHLYVLDGVTQRISGVVAGTNITVDRTTDGSGNQRLTLSGYDTLANYQAVLNAVTFLANGDNPTNFGANTTRTVTWQVNDGSAGNPSGTLNGADTNLRSTTITIQAVDDPAVAVDDAFATTESSSIGLGLNVFNANGGAADSDVDGPFQVTAVAGGTLGVQFTLASGALLTLNANGTFAYDPNGVFDYLPSPASGAANSTATDTFVYTVSGGDTATVTVTITGQSSDLDIYLGTPGIDTVTGGAGRDLFRSSLGGDSYDGQGGIDYISYAGSNTGVTVNLDSNVNTGGHAEGDTLTSIDHVTGSAFADDLTGNGGANQLNGGLGADRMEGLAGSDTYYVDDEGDVVVEAANGGSDTVMASVTYTLTDHVERLYLTGTAAIDGTGNGLGNLMRGNDAANTLLGLGGNDQLFGLAGADRLDGGDGSDRLTGGADADSFVFTAASHSRTGVLRDRILDFAQGDDVIDLSAIDADTRVGSPNDQAFVLIGTAAFTGAAAELRWQLIAGGETLILGDIDGDRRADFQIGLTGFAAMLTAGDFML